MKIDGKEQKPNEIYCVGSDGGIGLKLFAFPFSTNVVIEVAGQRTIVSAECLLAAAQLFSVTCKKPK